MTCRALCGSLLLLILLVILWSGCAPGTRVRSERTMVADEVLSRVRDRNERVRTLRGGGTITVEAPEGSNSGLFDAKLKKPDSLRVNFSGPFGIHLGTLMLTPDRFVFYSTMENLAVIGTPDGTTMSSLFRLQMRFEEVINAFTGEFPTTGERDSLVRFGVEDDRYVIRYEGKDGIREYRVDGDAFVVTSYRILDADGKSLLIADAAEVEEGEGIPMPRLLRVVFPRERRSVTIAYNDVSLNKPVQCSFTVPHHADVIYR